MVPYPPAAPASETNLLHQQRRALSAKMMTGMTHSERSFASGGHGSNRDERYLLQNHNPPQQPQQRHAPRKAARGATRAAAADTPRRRAHQRRVAWRRVPKLCATGKRRRLPRSRWSRPSGR